MERYLSEAAEDVGHISRDTGADREPTRKSTADLKTGGWGAEINRLRVQRDDLAAEVVSLRTVLDQLKITIPKLESGKSTIEESIRSANRQGQEQLEQIRKDGLNALIGWIEGYVDVERESGFGDIPGPRVIEIGDLIGSFSETDPNGLYIKFDQSEQQLNVHFPWIASNSTVQQTAATLALAFAAAIASSKPLSSSVSESRQAKRLAGLLAELEALENEVSGSSQGAGDAVHYSNLIKYLLTAMSHAEYDNEYVQLGVDEILSGVGKGISEWLDVVAPLYRPVIGTEEAASSIEYRQDLAKEVISDWIIGQDAFGHDSARNCNKVYEVLTEFLESGYHDRFDAAMIAALNNWREALGASIGQGNASGIGVAIVVDLTYRLGAGTMTADWQAR